MTDLRQAVIDAARCRRQHDHRLTVDGEYCEQEAAVIAALDALLAGRDHQIYTLATHAELTARDLHDTHATAEGSYAECEKFRCARTRELCEAARAALARTEAAKDEGR